MHTLSVCSSVLCARSVAASLLTAAHVEQELASKGRMVEDVVGALRNEEAAKLAAQRDAQTARTRMHQLEVCKHCLSHGCHITLLLQRLSVVQLADLDCEMVLC